MSVSRCVHLCSIDSDVTRQADGRRSRVSWEHPMQLYWAITIKVPMIDVAGRYNTIH